jgi:antirestriction protein ArdC
VTTKHNHAELIGRLTEGIGNLTTSHDWQRYLEFQSRFRHYSFANVLLIASQREDATRVAGFNAWRKMGRFVRKGEKAIWILAPIVQRTADADIPEDDRIVRGFKFVPVFDVAQTDGGALPTVCEQLRGGDPDGAYRVLSEVARSIGFTVVPHEFDGSTNGDCSHGDRRIRIEVRNGPAQQVKTLAHEIAHALLHARFGSRALAELEAESVAYVACQAIGIDSGEYSFGYVATWAGGGDQAIAAIRTSCARIEKTAATILRAFTPTDEDLAA